MWRGPLGTNCRKLLSRGLFNVARGRGGASPPCQPALPPLWMGEYPLILPSLGRVPMGTALRDTHIPSKTFGYAFEGGGGPGSLWAIGDSLDLLQGGPPLRRGRGIFLPPIDCYVFKHVGVPMAYRVRQLGGDSHCSGACDGSPPFFPFARAHLWSLLRSPASCQPQALSLLLRCPAESARDP